MEGFCQLHSQGLALGEGQIYSDLLLQYTAFQMGLHHHTIPSGMQLVGPEFVLMQDNDPKHTSKPSQRYIKSIEEQHILQMMS